MAVGSAALAGALILGVGGRLAMSYAAIALGQVPEFTWAGSLQVIGAAAWRGAVGGLLWLPFYRRTTWIHGLRGILIGSVAYVAALASVPSHFRALALRPELFPEVFLLFGALCLLWGWCVDAAVRAVAFRHTVR